MISKKDSVKTKSAKANAKNNSEEKQNKKTLKKTEKKPSKKPNAPKERKKSVRQSKPTQKKQPVQQKKGGIRNIKYLGGKLFAKMVRGGTSELRTNADEVNRLNVFPVPDGDTGDNMRMTIESGFAAIENVNTDYIADVMKLFSQGMLIGARGNSGVILSQFFAGLAKGLESEAKAGPEDLAKALEMGVDKAYTAVMTPTEGTILTVAREAVEYAVSRLTPESTIKTLFADLVEEMRNSLNRTPETLTILKEAGVVDSGGAGLFYIMDGFNRVLNGEDVPDIDIPIDSQKNSAPEISSFGPDSVMEYGYCTEFLLQLQNAKTNIAEFDIEALKVFLTEIGDSIVAFKNDSIVKVHVHTKEPEKVLAHARLFGEFITVKIENMSIQHSDLKEEEKENSESAPRTEEMPAEKKRYAMVAVSNGSGISEVFREFGVDQIVEGGQTNNPSTGDFLDAYEKINAEHIFVFPNNGNIILAAEQSAEIYEKAKIHVIPSKNIGAGYVAISSADLSANTPEEIIESMNEAIGRISTGYVSPAIRDADINGVHINNGDTIGIIEKEIVISKAEKLDAIFGLTEILLAAGDKSMLTIICGKDSTQEERDAISSYINEKFSYIEFYFINGNQEIASFIFVAE